MSMAESLPLGWIEGEFCREVVEGKSGTRKQTEDPIRGNNIAWQADDGTMTHPPLRTDTVPSGHCRALFGWFL